MNRLRRYSAAAVLLASLGVAGAAWAQDSGPKLFFEGDMVRGRTAAGTTGPTCVLASQYMHKEQVVFRVRVLDQNGNPIDDKALQSLVVKLPDGESFPMRFGPHPKSAPADSFWSVSWVIPDEYPTGTLSYSVLATNQQGQEQTWKPFNVSLSQLSVIPGDAVITPPPAN